MDAEVSGIHSVTDSFPFTAQLPVVWYVQPLCKRQQHGRGVLHSGELLFWNQDRLAGFKGYGIKCINFMDDFQLCHGHYTLIVSILHGDFLFTKVQRSFLVTPCLELVVDEGADVFDILLALHRSIQEV